MLFNKLHLLLLVIVVYLFCKCWPTIEGLNDLYSWSTDTDMVSQPTCSDYGNVVAPCHTISEACTDPDPANAGLFLSVGSECTINNIIGRCVQDDNDHIVCNIPDQNIADEITSEISAQIIIVPETQGESYYTIAPNGVTKTHAPACSDNSATCDGLVVRPETCLPDTNCCLCSQALWDKVYTSKPSDIINNNANKIIHN